MPATPNDTPLHELQCFSARVCAAIQRGFLAWRPAPDGPAPRQLLRALVYRGLAGVHTPAAAAARADADAFLSPWLIPDAAVFAVARGPGYAEMWGRVSHDARAELAIVHGHQ